MEIRTAIVTSDSALETIQRYLPGNYKAVEFSDAIVIVGADNAGWTLDGYVLPRLASGLHFAQETIAGR